MEGGRPKRGAGLGGEDPRGEQVWRGEELREQQV